MTENNLQEKTVILKKIYITRDGSSYYPGEYAPHCLPASAYTKDFVEEKTSSISINTSNEVIKETRIQFTKDPKVEEYRPKDSQKHIEILKPKAKEDKLGINGASLSQLIDLNGVGKSTALKVIEARQEKEFSSYEDLNERVPLPLGKEWQIFQLDF
jgi:DNA uptake protein ComE-like DNA-binding protein